MWFHDTTWFNQVIAYRSNLIAVTDSVAWMESALDLPVVSQGRGCETSHPENLRPRVPAVRSVSHPCALSMPLRSDTQRQLRDK